MNTTNQNAPVITSLGLLTPYGLGLEAFLAGLSSGEPLPSPALCPELDLKNFLPSEKTYLDRCSELALVAAALALRGDTGETPVPLTAGERVGLGLGTAYGCLDSMNANTQRVQTKGARLASPLLFMHSFVNAPASLIAIEWGLQGPGATFTDGGLSAASALYWACDLLRRGEVDMMLVGGVEALGKSLVEGLGSVVGESGAQPWEAAAIFCVERAAFAAARGAQVLAEVVAVRLGPADDEPPAATPYYAFGAQFALLVAAALGAGGGSQVVAFQEGLRAAEVELSLA
ncbi:MAG TPA: beta-ketoacyl synthase N-terminal-like domain-containing protein [Armatimonadota bacterium]|jgi:3-oxoacyl-[acyl-carrier-protein] synthase II